MDHADPPAHDAELLRGLRAVAQRMDPVPDQVIDGARAAYTWRTVDAELAELSYDSMLDEHRLAGVRGGAGAGARALSFEGPEFSVELEVVVDGPLRRLVGQLVPPDPADIEVRHAGGLSRVAADEVGRFAAAGVVPGPVSLRVLLAAAAAPPVETAWVTL